MLLKMESNVYLVDLTGFNEISGFCRLCLLKNDKMTSIYENTIVFGEKTTSAFEELQRFSKLKLSKDPEYPSLICSTCLNLLRISWKIRIQMELSQKQLLKYFNIQTLHPDFLENNKNIAPVELISNKGRFNLKELIIIEEEEEENEKCYEGFLKNLGSVISAKYADRNSYKEITVEDPVVNIIRLNDFIQTENVDLNLENKESSDELFLCEICGFITKKKHQFAYHMSSKHSDKIHKCDICNKSYSAKYRLEQHKTVHKNERPYLCTVCGNNFNYLSALEYHMRMHTGERRYKCVYCPKAFGMSWGLKRHLTIHTGARPFKCRFCNKGFASRGEVKYHELLHTGERPHSCKICKKGFTKSYNLKTHMLSHDGPFKCSFCPKGFLDGSMLKMHYKISHTKRKKDDVSIVVEECQIYEKLEEENEEDEEVEEEGEDLVWQREEGQEIGEEDREKENRENK